MSAVDIRPAAPGDAPFILDSFARSYASSAFAEGLGPATLRALIKPLLEAWPTLVATEAEDADHLIGWICYRDATTAAYVYVKPWFRRKGVATALVRTAGVAQGPVVTPFAHSRAPAVRAAGYLTTFRPFLVVEEALRA